ncbi:MAG TPA: hypothetical protein VIK50_01325 [Gemmatimonadaceae bacterium]
MVPRSKAPALVVACGAIGLALGCGNHGGNGGPTGLGPPGGLANCSAPQFLTTSLVLFENIRFISPLGNLNPPPHTFPTDHLYFYMAVATAAIVAPGDIVVTEVLVQHRTGGGQPDLDDYSVTFFPCADVMIQLGHVARLGTQFSAKVGALDGECAAPYPTGGFTYQQCRKSVNVSMAAGEAIGVTGGTLDVFARDRRVNVSWANPARLSDAVGDFGDRHVACAIDYFVAPIGDQLRSKLGTQGAVRRTPPVCGDVAQDVVNTAAGRWFQPGSPTYPEDPHLALAHDNVVPSLGVFSVGTSIPSLPANVYTFPPVPIGRTNLDFRYVATVGEIICYTVSRNQRVLLQLVSAVRLKVEGIGPGACGDPGTWAFSAGAVEFER